MQHRTRHSGHWPAQSGEDLVLASGVSAVGAGGTAPAAAGSAADQPHVRFFVMVACGRGEVVELADLLGGQLDAVGGGVLLDPGTRLVPGIGRDCPAPGQRRRPYLLFLAARKQAEDHGQSWSARLACSSARPAPRSSRGAPISQAEPSTAGRPPMIGATEPSSPAASPVSVRYPGSPAGWEVSGSSWRDRVGASSGGVDPAGSFSVMVAISLGEHIHGPAQTR